MINLSDPEIRNLTLNKLANFIKKYDQGKRTKGYKKKKDLFPTFEIMQKAINVTKEDLISLLRELENKKIIGRNVSQYFYNYENPAEKKLKNKLLQNREVNRTLIKINPYKIIVGITGTITTIISTYFTKIWFDNFLNPVLSSMISISLILFSIIALQTINKFQNEKKYLTMLTFIILWIMVLFFSMISTIAGQLNLEQVKLTKINIQNERHYKNKEKHELLKEEKNMLILDISSIQKERKYLVDALSKISILDKKELYNDINYRIYLKNKKLEDLQKKLNFINKKEDEIINTYQINKKINDNIYTWISNFMGINPKIIQFILYLIPALFIDLISPIMFLLLRKE